MRSGGLGRAEGDSSLLPLACFYLRPDLVERPQHLVVFLDPSSVVVDVAEVPGLVRVSLGVGLHDPYPEEVYVPALLDVADGPSQIDFVVSA